MKNSIYNFVFSVDSAQYVYNLLTTAIAEINEKVASAIRENKLALICDKDKSDLYANGFLVDDCVDETKAYQYFYDSIRYGRSATTLHVTIIPTYACNLACPYCLQGSSKDSNFLSLEQLNSILKFIRTKSLPRKNYVAPDRLFVSFYGGEPMLAKHLLPYFCDETARIADEAEIERVFDMTSNFTLLDDAMMDLIRKHKINVQVSIDGSREQHNQRRIFPDGRGTYDLILQNLKKMADAGLSQRLTIRINTDRDSLHSARETFNAVRGFAGSVYFSFLATYKGANDSYANCIPPDCYSAIMMNNFNPILRANGDEEMRLFGKKSPCALVCENKYWIDCFLDVYKCETLVKRPECKIGTLSANGELQLNYAYYEQMNCVPFSQKKCCACKLLPVCGGGCPAKEYIDAGKNDGKINNCQCAITEEKLRRMLVSFVCANRQENICVGTCVRNILAPPSDAVTSDDVKTMP